MKLVFFCLMMSLGATAVAHEKPVCREGQTGKCYCRPGQTKGCIFDPIGPCDRIDKHKCAK